MTTRGPIPILGFSTKPDVSGDVWAEPYAILASNDVWDDLIFRFRDTATRVGLRGRFRIPPEFVAAPLIVIEWTAAVTTGNVVWDFDYRAITGDNAESLDQAGVQESVTVTDAAPGAAHRRLIATVALTAANLAAGDLVEFALYRDGTDAGDTMAADAALVWLGFQYSDV